MKRIHVSGISIKQIIDRHKMFQGLKWFGNEKFPDMSNINIIERESGNGGIIADHDSFGGKVAWAYFEGKNPLIGKVMGELDKEEGKFLRKDYPTLYSAIINLDA